MRSGSGGLLILLVVLGLPRLLLPGDVPFIADEPLIVERALDALEEGRLASVGLEGTRGASYGPAPTWIYQAALAVTSDLRLVVVAKVLLTTALTGLALLLLARHVSGLVPSLGAFAFLSPYLWFYSRDLWDNSFAVPFSAMLLAAYAAYCDTDRLRFLAGTGLLATLCLTTHLMTAPLVAAVLVHFVVSHRGRLVGSRRFLLWASAIGTGSLVLALPYLLRLPAASAATNLLWTPSPSSLAFAFDGFRIFTLVGFDYFIGDWEAGGVGPALRIVSGFSYVVGAYGLYLLNRELRRDGVWTAGRASSTGTDASGPAVEEHSAELGAGPPSGSVSLAGVVALTLVFWVILANGTRLVGHPHYYNGVWIVFFLLWWMGMSALARRVWACRVWYVQVAAMALFLPAMATWLGRNHGTKSLHYGPTLENQMAVARQLDRLGIEGLPPSRAHHPRLFPQAIRVLRRLHARGGGTVADAGPPRSGYEIVYVDPDGPGGEIMLQREGIGDRSGEPGDASAEVGGSSDSARLRT